ncbi:MAG: hypothetical protein ACYDDA_03820 [Acidiferrobacteraceae bacterium]
MNGYNPIEPAGGFLSGATAPAKPVKVVLRASKTMAPGFPGFFAWLAKAHPDLYTLIRVRYPNIAYYEQYLDPAPILEGLGQSTDLTPIDVTATTLPTLSDTTSSSSGGWASDLVNALTSAAPTVIATVDQQKIFNTQLSRAQQGLPPLNTSSYGLPSMTGAISALTTPVIVIGALGLGFLILRRR